MRRTGLQALVVTTGVLTFSGALTWADVQSGVREVTATDRGVITLQTRCLVCGSDDRPPR